MKTIISLFASGIIILFAAINTTKACVPASSATVFSTINITANGYTQVTNMPTGTVIQLNITLPYTQVYFNFCATNVGMVPSGTNDGFATILDANGPSANEITTGDDGCSNVSAPGYGPPNFEYTFVTTGTYFLYLTEYDPSGSDECFGSNGSNSSFIADIDYVVPGVFDVNPLPGANEYTRIPLPIATIPVSGSVFNYGSTMGTFNLYGDVFQLPNTTTPVQSYSLLNNTVNAFETTSQINLGTYTPTAVGDYNIRINTTSASDPNPANDTVFATVKITTDVYARDQNAPDNILITGGSDKLDLVQLFDFNVSADIPGIYVALLSDTSVNFSSDSLQLEVFAAVNDSPTTLLASSAMMPLTAYVPNNFNLISLSQTLSLLPGSYFFGVKFVEGSSRSGVGTDGNSVPDRATWAKGVVTGNMWVDLGAVIYVRPRVLPGTLVGVKNVSSNHLLLYPNPAKNQLFVLAPSLFNETATISLHTIDGRMVYNESIETNKNHTIDVSNFATGVYIVKLQSNQSSITQRVVVE